MPKVKASVFPNPSSSFVIVDLDAIPVRSCKLVITTINGEKILTADVNHGSRVSIDHLSSGLYVYTIQNMAGSTICRDKMVVIK